MTAENQKTRLHRLELVFLRAPRYFVTACTHNRRHILANPSVHERFLRFAEQGPEHGAWVGAYVFMPDHFHAFVAVDEQKVNLSTWAKSAKELNFQNAAAGRHCAAALAEDIFRSSLAQRRVLHGEVALRARKTRTSRTCGPMERLAVSRRSFSARISL
jgi:REP element-mobilizing transposase RayT